MDNLADSVDVHPKRAETCLDYRLIHGGRKRAENLEIARISSVEFGRLVEVGGDHQKGVESSGIDSVAKPFLNDLPLWWPVDRFQDGELPFAVLSFFFETPRDGRGKTTRVVYDGETQRLIRLVAVQKGNQKSEGDPENGHDKRADKEAFRLNTGQILAFDDEPNFTHGSSSR